MKKFVSLAMVLALCLCLFAGCGQESGDPTENPEATAPAGETGEPTAEGAAFYFGAVGPLTGENAIYGNAVMNGAQIAVDEINAAGGINGYQVEFSFEDDVSDGETASTPTTSSWTTACRYSSAPSPPARPSPSPPQVYDDRIFCPDPQRLLPRRRRRQGQHVPALLHRPQPGHGRRHLHGRQYARGQGRRHLPQRRRLLPGHPRHLRRRGENQSLDVVYEGTFTAESATDFSVQLTGAQSAGADVVFLPIYYQPASIILAQADAMGYEPTFFGVDGMDGILTMPNFDMSLAEGVMVLTPFSADATDERTVSFVTEYNERFGETPNQFAADGYDCVYALKQALEAADCTPDMSDRGASATPSIEQFTSMSFDGLTGSGLTWGTDGTVSKLPMAVVIHDGAYVSAENA